VPLRDVPAHGPGAQLVAGHPEDVGHHVDDGVHRAHLSSTTSTGSGSSGALPGSSMVYDCSPDDTGAAAENPTDDQNSRTLSFLAVGRYMARTRSTPRSASSPRTWYTNACSARRPITRHDISSVSHTASGPLTPRTIATPTSPLSPK